MTLNRSLGEESEKGVSIASVSRLLQVQVQLLVIANPESRSSPELWGQAPQISQASLKVVVFSLQLMEAESSHLFGDGVKCSLEEPTKKNILKERFSPWLICLSLRWLKIARVSPSLNLLKTLPLNWE